MASVPNVMPDLNPSTTSNIASSTAPMMSNGAYDGSQLPSTVNDQQQLGQLPPLSQTSQLSSQSQQTPNQTRSVKRPRPVKSCTECRKRKLKCDRSCPCSQCLKSHRSCKYATDNDAANLSDGSDGEMTETGRPQKKPCFSTPGGHQAAGGSLDMAYTPLRNGELANLTLEEVAYRLEKLEKMILAKSPTRTDQSASRTHLNAAAPSTIRGLTVKRGALRTRFFGQSSTRVLINLFPEARNYMFNPRRIDGLRETFRQLETLQKMLREEHRKSTAAISVYVDSMLPIPKRMTDVMPAKSVCDRLLAAYIDANEIIYRMVHVPTFREQYELYWEGKLQAESFLPQLLTVLAIGTRFVAKSKGLGHERLEGVHIPTACALVRIWLDGLRGKQLVEFTTLQTEVLLLHANRMMSLLRAHDAWTQLGYIVRMAMTMGLHRDPSEFEKLPVFYGELRRRLWFTILDMDLHISLACNLPCLIREGDYTCKPPRNLDDADLYEDMVELPQGKPIEQHTECQIQVYASTTLPTRLKVAHLVNRIDTIRDYQEVLDVGQRLDRYIEDINYVFPRHGLTDQEKSKQWRWRVIMDMHVRRPLLQLYRPFALGVPDAPPQIVRAYLRSSMVILRYLDELDPSLPHYQEVGDMYLQILKQDIIQASFSICFYIQNMLTPSVERSQASYSLGHSLSPESMDEMSFASDSVMLGTPSRLISTVQKSIDLLVRNVMSCDLKDIVPLGLVFQCMQRGSQPPAPDEVVRGIQMLLEACLRYTNTTVDKLNAYAASHQQQHPPPPPPPDAITAGAAPPMDPYGQGPPRPPYAYHGTGPNGGAMMGPAGNSASDEYFMWDMDSWSTLLPPPQTA